MVEILNRVTMQFFVRGYYTMIAAPVQRDIDGIPQGSHDDFPQRTKQRIATLFITAAPAQNRLSPALPLQPGWPL